MRTRMRTRRTTTTHQSFTRLECLVNRQQSGRFVDVHQFNGTTTTTTATTTTSALLLLTRPLQDSSVWSAGSRVEVGVGFLLSTPRYTIPPLPRIGVPFDPLWAPICSCCCCCSCCCWSCCCCWRCCCCSIWWCCCCREESWP